MQSKKRYKLLFAKDINFCYGSKSVLSKINFEISAGEVIGIVGESGSGKTTLLKVLGAKLAPDSGQVLFKGESVYHMHNQLLRGHDDIRIVDQDFDLMPYITVDENIIRNSLSLSDSSRKRLVGQLKSTLKLKDVGKNKAVHTSGGQKQRVALATAVATNPEVLILDEPFANLDYSLKVDIIQLLKDQWKAKAMIIVAHEPADLLSLCDRIVVMKKGKIIQRGNSIDVYQNPKNLYVARLLGPINELSTELSRALNLKDRNWLRPHELTIGNKGLEAEVNQVHFCGSYYDLELNVTAFKQLLNLHYFGSSIPKVGDKVFVSI